MVLSSVPATLLGALLLATRSHSLPHTSNEDPSGVLRVPISSPKSDSDTFGIAKRQIKADMSRTYREHMLIMNVKASPGNQEISLAVDTASHITWTNPNCKTAGHHAILCETLKHYRPEGSPLGAPFPADYVSGSATVQRYSAAVKIGGATIQDFPLGVATDSNNLPIGILGLSPAPAGDEENSIIDLLQKQGTIQSRVFSVDVAQKVFSKDGKTDGKNKDQKDPGSVIFGGVDVERFSGKLQTLPMLPLTGDNPKYIVNLKEVSFSLSGSQFSAAQDYLVTMDTGSGAHVFPPSVVQYIANMFFGKIDKGNLKVPCSYRDFQGGIRYQFGNKEIVTSFKDLVAPPFRATDEFCHMRIAQGSENKMTLGLPFFESAYTVFDLDNQQFHVAQAANCGSTVVKIERGRDGVPLQGRCQ